MVLLALCSNTGANVKHSKKFKPYYAFISTADAGSLPERRAVVELALKLIFKVLSEKCKYVLTRLRETKPGGIRRTDKRISRLNCDGQVDDEDDNDDRDDYPSFLAQRALLRARWTQISVMVERAIWAARRELEILDAKGVSGIRGGSGTESGAGSGAGSGSAGRGGSSRERARQPVPEAKGSNRAEADVNVNDDGEDDGGGDVFHDAVEDSGLFA